MPLKILCLTPSYKPAYKYGGTIESVSRLCEEFLQAGHKMEVFTTSANGSNELPVAINKRMIIDGVPVTYFKRITKDPTHISPALWRKLYKECTQYDLVHIHSWWNILVVISALICFIRKVKIIVSPHGMLSDYILHSGHSFAKRIIHFSMGKMTLRKTTFHATSKAEYNECKKIIPSWNGFVIPNIVNLPETRLEKQEPKAFTLLFLSRIHPKKGIEILLDALSKIKAPFLLRIVGWGALIYVNELKHKARKLGVDRQVEWVGWKEGTEKFDEFAKANLFVLLSYNENFANTVIESLYIGTPVLISEKVGLAGFIEKEKLGWIVPLESEIIARKIECIMRQREQLKWITDNSNSIIKQNFSGKKLIELYIEHYHRVINKNLVQ